MTARSRCGGSHLSGVGSRAVDWLLALRPHQWIKNVVVFAPLVAAHQRSLGSYLAALGMFAALSACASGTYLLNDLLDLPYDRTHPRKRNRPLAAGRLPLLPAAGLGVALMALGTVAAFGLSPTAGLSVLCYVLVTSAYSLSLKRRLFVDVAALALLFTIRTVAGAAVGAVTLSSWFLAFAFFVFLALAILKRQSECRGCGRRGGRHCPAAPIRWTIVRCWRRWARPVEWPRRWCSLSTSRVRRYACSMADQKSCGWRVCCSSRGWGG